MMQPTRQKFEAGAQDAVHGSDDASDGDGLHTVLEGALGRGFVVGGPAHHGGADEAEHEVGVEEKQVEAAPEVSGLDEDELGVFLVA